MTRVLATLTLLAAIGCEEKVEKPTPPDVSALTPSYFAPDGVLTDANAGDVVLALESRLTAGGALCGWTGADDLLCAGRADCPLSGCAGISFVFEAVDSFGVARSDGGPTPAGDAGTPVLAGVELRGDGFVRIHRICPGEVDAPVPDEDTNGAVDLVMGFTDEGIDPVVWGDFERCRFDVPAPVTGDPIEIVLDGNINLVLGDGPWLGADGLAPILQILGAGTIDSEATDVSVDFQIDFVAAELRIGVALADGSTFLFYAASDRAGFRTEEADWTCDFGGMTCTDGTRTVSW